MTKSVVLVGYAPELQNGVSKNTEFLLRHLPYARLHIAVRCYYPRWKWLTSSVLGLASFALQLVLSSPTVVQILLGSRGDTVKTLPYLLLAKVRGCKVSLQFRTNRANLLSGLPSGVRWIVLRCWRSADRYCFFTHRLADELGSELGPDIPRIIIPNPIASEWMDTPALSGTARTRGLVFLGRWSHEKGMDDLLGAMRTLDVNGARHCDIYSDVLPKRDPENCTCHAWLDEVGVRRVLREAKLLLLPSHFEGYPNVLVQAAACGTPFVATRLAGVLDIVEESNAGLLHDVGDVAGMQQAIRRLLTDDQLWNECSRNGRRWAESLEVSRIVPAWDAFYASLGVVVPNRTASTLGPCSRVASN